VLYTVEDSGDGISDEVSEQIFDPFFTTKAVGLGTGLGLSLCHGIAAEHGGSITTDSSDLGGACFTVRLPKNLPEDYESQRPTATTSGSKSELVNDSTTNQQERLRGRILVVDDEEIVRDSLAVLLRSTDVSLTLAADGEAGKTMLQQHRYDLLVTDIRMPHMDGVELTNWVKINQPDLPVLIMTGWTEEADLQTAKNAGAFACVNKPFDSEEIVKLARAAMKSGLSE